AFHLGLAAELALGADLARDTRHLGGKRRQLVDHAVDGRADAEELALDRAAVDLQLDALREVSVRDRVDDARHLDRRPDEVLDHRVDRVDLLLPHALRSTNLGPLRQAPFAADHGRDADELVGRALARLRELVERARQPGRHAPAPGGDADAAV